MSFNGIFWKLALPVSVLFGLLIAFLIFYIPNLAEQDVKRSVALSAELTAKQFKGIRAYYTQNVIKKVLTTQDLRPGIDHKNNANMIPLPATMIHDLSEQLQAEGLAIKLYSAYPFPNRKSRVLSAFQHSTWDKISANPLSKVIAEETVNGEKIIKVAIADIMVDESCVNCHNTRADTPKNDWKLGDVRGVLQIDTNITQQLAAAKSSSNKVISVLTLILVMTLAAIFIVLKYTLGSKLILLKEAVTVAEQIASGKFENKITANTDCEVGDLLRAFDQMQQNLNKSITADRKALATNTRIKQALDHSSNNTLVVDVHNNIVYCNKAMNAFLDTLSQTVTQDMASITLGEVAGAMTLLQLLPNHRQQTTELVENTAHNSVEISIDQMQLTLIASPVFDDAGSTLGTVIEWQDHTLEIATEKEVQEVVDNALAGNLSSRIPLEGKIGFLASLSRSVNQLVNVTETISSDTLRVMGAMAKGDLTQKIETDYSGVFDQVKQNINATNVKLIEVVSQIKVSSHSLTQSSAEFSMANADLKKRTQEQTSSLQSTTNSMSHIHSKMQRNSQFYTQVSDAVTATRESALQGKEAVDKSYKAMKQLEQSSKSISSIVEFIDSISFQINLLALNAAVEAARAGEAGRGFSVVASEVRSLSNLCAKSAKEISVTIKASHSQVLSGMKLAQESGDVLDEITHSVNSAAELVNKIVQLSQEQTQGVKEINTSISTIENIAHKNSMMVEKANSDSENLVLQVAQLTKMTEFFSHVK